MSRCHLAIALSPHSRNHDQEAQPMSPTPALDLLMGAYFHQDWVDENEDEAGVVDLFISQEPGAAKRIPAEIEMVLDQCSREEELRHFIIDVLGAYYLADSNGGTYRGWLTKIADRVRRATTAAD